MSPVTVIVVHGAAQLPVTPPGDDVAVKLVIGLPPLLAGAENVTLALPLPAVAVPIAGAPGTVANAFGVTGFEAADAAPVPIAFIADTLIVYAVPFVSPETVIEVHGAMHVPVDPPGAAVAR